MEPSLAIARTADHLPFPRSVGEIHSAPDVATAAVTVTLMFTDIEGFTELTERLGDRRALEVIRVHNTLIRKQAAAHSGFEVELTGDGFLMAFPTPRHALLCALAVQRAFAEHNFRQPEEPIRVRIGIHSGEVIVEKQRVFGKTVIFAARTTSHARGGEILVSSPTRQLTDGAGDLTFDDGRELQLKGLAGSHRLYRLEWQARSLREVSAESRSAP